MDKKMLHMVSMVLVWLGALNWGLIGLVDLNLVAAVFGPDSLITRLVYILIGLAAVYSVMTHQKDCKICSRK